MLNAFGVIAGTNGKCHFARPASAKHAADILGTTPEELSRAIFIQGPSSQSSLSPAFRFTATSVTAAAAVSSPPVAVQSK